MARLPTLQWRPLSTPSAPTSPVPSPSAPSRSKQEASTWHEGRGLCRTSKFDPRFCTHTAHDGAPARSDSLGGVISAISRGGTVAPALRPENTDDIRVRASVAGPRGRDGGAEPSRAPRTPHDRASQRAASHPSRASTLADITPPISPRGIASERTGHPGPWRRAVEEETELPSTSRNGARQEPEDNADQAGRSQGRAAREGRPGS